MNFLRRFFTKKKLYIGIPCVVLALFISFALPHITHAGFLDVVTNPLWLITLTIEAITYIVNYILSFFLMFASFLVDIAMGFNEDILSPSNTLLKVGWNISRDIANLGFVIAIVVIAFATIIRIESYGSQKLLTKLIAAAILVNFSLAIPGVLITFTNSLTNFFLGGTNTDFSLDLSLGDMIVGAFNPQRLALTLEDPPPPDPSETGGGGFTTETLLTIVNLTFSVTFTLIATIVMFILAIMFMIRYIILSFLLVLAPLTWFFWIIPSLQEHFQKWWSTFFKWAFFGPASSFFIYLAMQSLKGLSTERMSQSTALFAPIDTVIKQGGQMIIITGILLAGIVVAEKMGLAGGKAAVGAVMKGSQAAAKWSGKRSLETMKGRPFGGRLNQKLGEWNEKAQKGELGGIRGFIGKNYVTAKTKSSESKIGKATSSARQWTKDKYKKGKDMFENVAYTTGANTLGENMWKGIKEGSGLFKKEEKKELPNTTGEITGEVAKINEQIAKVEKRTDEESKKKLKELNGRKNQLLAQYAKIKEEEILSAEEPLKKLDEEIDALKKKMEKENRIKGLESKSTRTDEENEELKSFNALSKEEKEKQIPKAGEAEIFKRMNSLRGKLYDQGEKEKKAELNNLNQKIDTIEAIPEKERTDQHKTDLEKYVSRVQEIKQTQGEQKNTNSKDFGFVIPESQTTQQSPRLTDQQLEDMDQS